MTDAKRRPLPYAADHHSVISYALTMLRTLRGFIVPGEQAHLANVFGRALATARRRGELVEGDRLRFWPGSVVMSLELPSYVFAGQPLDHPSVANSFLIPSLQTRGDERASPARL